MTRLTGYSWSGNVRELSDGEQAFEALVAGGHRGSTATSPGAPIVTESLREIARRSAREAERNALAEVLERVHWNRAEASRILKVSYKTLLNKIAECGLAPRSPRGAGPQRPGAGALQTRVRSPTSR